MASNRCRVLRGGSWNNHPTHGRSANRAMPPPRTATTTAGSVVRPEWGIRQKAEDGDMLGVDIPKETLAEFCRRNRIRKLALFGSVVRGELRPDIANLAMGKIAGKGRKDFDDDENLRLALTHLIQTMSPGVSSRRDHDGGA